MLKFICINICLFFSFLFAYSQNFENENIPIHDITLTLEDYDLSFLDELVDKKNHFFCSELHRSNLAIEQHKIFISYLSEKGKTPNKLIYERPYSYSYLINQYLKSGDTSILKNTTDRFYAFDRFKKNLGNSHDSFGFFQWLRNFNKSQKTNIEVIGVDLDQELNGLVDLYAIYFFIKKNKLETELPFFTDLEYQVQKKENSRKELKKWVRVLNEFNFKKVTNTLEVDQQKILDKLLTSIIDTEKFKGVKKEEYRESTLYRNYKREVKPNDILYSQFGAGHIFLKNDERNNFAGFLSRVLKDSNFKKITTSIYLHCEYCELGEAKGDFKPYFINKEKPKYYTWHNWLFVSDDEHDKIISKLNKKSVVMDVRNATDEKYDLMKRYFDFMIILF